MQVKPANNNHFPFSRAAASGTLLYSSFVFQEDQTKHVYILLVSQSHTHFLAIMRKYCQ